MEESSPAATSPQWWQNEDWLAVIVGGLLIAAVLAGWRPALPAFNWMTSAHLAKGIRALQQQTSELDRLQQESAKQGEVDLAAGSESKNRRLARGRFLSVASTKPVRAVR